MAHATLSVTLPDRVWIAQISRDHPEATFRVLAGVPGEETGFALVNITGPDVESVAESMAAHDQLTELTPAQVSEGELTVHFETTAPLLLFSSQESGMPLEPPTVIRDGEAEVDVTGSRSRLSDLADRLEAFGFEYRVEHVRERLHDNQLLTERQREVIVAAVEAGYYDTPRTCTLTELAEELTIAKSTCSETLHRAEETIIKRFVADLPTADRDGTLEAALTES